MKLQIAELIDAAQAQTRLRDFGGETFREGLEVLVDALEREARLTEAGTELVRAHLLRLLANRLQIEDWYRRHPSIDAQDVEAPMIVIGLPRTGTTALSHLLAQDPDTRSLRTWEAAAPAPPPEAATQYSDPRIAAAQKGLDEQHAALPEMRALYDATATSPAECMDLLGMEFRAQHFCGQYRIPSFARWQLHCDMEPAYRYHKRTLKLLQWHCPPRRWHLKTPVHMLSLDALDRVYPDARFVMTHRDPSRVLGSVCSLISLTRRQASGWSDPVELGRDQLELWVEALRRTLAFRERAGEQRFVDVQFEPLNRDPIGTVERIYRHFGLVLGPAARAAMGQWAAAHPRGRHGEHRYALEDFGLEPREVRSAYAFYTQRFGVPLEQA